jgi:fatty-acyl-CoA synthase
MKDVIKSGGEWISSIELEDALNSHPKVWQSCVIGIPDERWQERPLGVVVADPDSPVSGADLQQWLSDRVARWWVPRSWAFVSEIPMAGVGKHDKKLLRERYARGDLKLSIVSMNDRG